jgi:hypothetical protein
MFRSEFVAVHALAVGLGIGGMKIEPMLTGNVRECFLDVGAKLVRTACFARIIAGHCESTAQFAA